MNREERIARYEGILDRAEAAARRMEEALDACEGIRDDLRALEAYYTSPAWKEDYDADAAGLLPAGLRRGVLSEDGIDHVLERFRELKDRLARVPAEETAIGNESERPRGKLILISGSPCVGKTAVGKRLFGRYENSAYLDGDWCWCVNPFSVADRRLRNGDRSMSFVLSNYLDSGFEYVFFASVVLTDPRVRENILAGVTASGYETVGFTLTCSEETLKQRHDRRGDKGETDFRWLRLPPCPGDIVIDTDGKTVRDVVREMARHIDGATGRSPATGGL